MADRPPRPARLRARGRGFWDATTGKYDLTAGEVQLLAEVCRTLDECEALSRALAADGVTVEGSKGQTRAHPALGELRAARVVLSRLLAQLQLPDDDGQAIPSAAALRSRTAAGQRWRNFHAVYGEGGGDGPA
jgi:hypothetical protein